MTIQDLLNTNPNESTSLDDIVINIKDNNGYYLPVSRIIFESDDEGVVVAVLQIDDEFIEQKGKCE